MISQNIEYIFLDLSHSHSLQVASSPRDYNDYTLSNLRNNSYVPPPNVARSLYLPSSVARFQATARSEGVEDFKLLFIRHNLLLSSGEVYPVPSYATASYTFYISPNNPVKVNSPVVSVLHILPANSLTNEERLQVIHYYFGKYLSEVSNQDVCVVVIPPRKEESPTHQAFAKLAVLDSETGKIFQQTYDSNGIYLGNAYYFPYGKDEKRIRNIKKAQMIMNNVKFKESFASNTKTWILNEFETNRDKDPEQKEIRKQQIIDTAVLIIDSWKTYKSVQNGV